ncbi:hypothetical protein TNCV_310361 [Trichonephila clavipes]|nr:hypothetical protein TNCV_310361 [Trichonephila clavipes]
MSDGRTPFPEFGLDHAFAQKYKYVLERYVRLFLGTIGQYFIFMEDNAEPRRVNLVDNIVEEEGICRKL